MRNTTTLASAQRGAVRPLKNAQLRPAFEPAAHACDASETICPCAIANSLTHSRMLELLHPFAARTFLGCWWTASGL